jgi:dTDP-L-rhamnose 4-epimerase
MRALVTGGAGLIGSHIVDRLLERGDEVRIVDNLQKPCHLLGKPSWIPEEAEFILGDVRDKARMTEALKGVDVVFHEAAYQGLLPEFSQFFDVNSAGTALIYEVIVENRYPVRKIIIASSQAVYNEGRYNCPNHDTIYPPSRSLRQLEQGWWELMCPACVQEITSVPTTESTVAPQTMYAQSKHSQETIGMHLGRTYKIPTVALRYAITVGPRQSHFNAYSGVCSIFAARILNGLPPIVYEDGLQTRDYVSVGDVAEANLFVMEEPRADFRVFNVGTGRSVTVLQLLEVLTRLLGKDVEPQIAGSFRLGDIRHFTPDVSKLSALGWTAKAPFEESIRRYGEWITSQGDVKECFSEAEAVMKGLGVIRRVRTKAPAVA